MGILLKQDVIKPFYLVLLNISTPLRDTTLSTDYTYYGNVFQTNGKLASVEPPRMSSTVDREAYKISYADPDFSLRPYMGAAIVGKRLEVYLGLVNNSGSSLGGYADGEPMGEEHVIPIYKGWVDSPSYVIDPDGKVTASVEGCSPMGALGMSNKLITTKDSLMQRNSSDTSFNKIYEGSKGIQLLWGKK